MLKPQRASGKFVLRLDPALHHILRQSAHQRGISLNQMCVELLEKGLNVATPLVEEILRAFSPKIAAIVLFGSAARGEQWQESSDVDLLIVLKHGQRVTRSLYSQWDRVFSDREEFKHVSPQFIAFPEYIDDAGSIWLETALDGKILWDTDQTIETFLRKVRNNILAGKWRREISHGQPYWTKSDEK